MVPESAIIEDIPFQIDFDSDPLGVESEGGGPLETIPEEAETEFLEPAEAGESAEIEANVVEVDVHAADADVESVGSSASQQSVQIELEEAGVGAGGAGVAGGSGTALGVGAAVTGIGAGAMGGIGYGIKTVADYVKSTAHSKAAKHPSHKLVETVVKKLEKLDKHHNKTEALGKALMVVENHIDLKELVKTTKKVIKDCTNCEPVIRVFYDSLNASAVTSAINLLELTVLRVSHDYLDVSPVSATIDNLQLHPGVLPSKQLKRLNKSTKSVKVKNSFITQTTTKAPTHEPCMGTSGEDRGSFSSPRVCYGPYRFKLSCGPRSHQDYEISSTVAVVYSVHTQNLKADADNCKTLAFGLAVLNRSTGYHDIPRLYADWPDNRPYAYGVHRDKHSYTLTVNIWGKCEAKVSRSTVAQSRMCGTKKVVMSSDLEGSGPISGRDVSLDKEMECTTRSGTYADSPQPLCYIPKKTKTTQYLTTTKTTEIPPSAHGLKNREKCMIARDCEASGMKCLGRTADSLDWGFCEMAPDMDCHTHTDCKRQYKNNWMRCVKFQRPTIYKCMTLAEYWTKYAIWLLLKN